MFFHDVSNVLSKDRCVLLIKHYCCFQTSNYCEYSTQHSTLCRATQSTAVKKKIRCFVTTQTTQMKQKHVINQNVYLRRKQNTHPINRDQRILRRNQNVWTTNQIQLFYGDANETNILTPNVYVIFHTFRIYRTNFLNLFSVTLCALKYDFSHLHLGSPLNIQANCGNCFLMLLVFH